MVARRRTDSWCSRTRGRRRARRRCLGSHSFLTTRAERGVQRENEGKGRVPPPHTHSLSIVFESSRDPEPNIRRLGCRHTAKSPSAASRQEFTEQRSRPLFAFRETKMCDVVPETLSLRSRARCECRLPPLRRHRVVFEGCLARVKKTTKTLAPRNCEGKSFYSGVDCR